MSAARTSASTAIAAAELVSSDARCTGPDVAAAATAAGPIPLPGADMADVHAYLPDTRAHAGHQAR